MSVTGGTGVTGKIGHGMNIPATNGQQLGHKWCRVYPKQELYEKEFQKGRSRNKSKEKQYPKAKLYQGKKNKSFAFGYYGQQAGKGARRQKDSGEYTKKGR